MGCCPCENDTCCCPDDQDLEVTVSGVANGTGTGCAAAFNRTWCLKRITCGIYRSGIWFTTLDNNIGCTGSQTPSSHYVYAALSFKPPCGGGLGVANRVTLYFYVSCDPTNPVAKYDLAFSSWTCGATNTVSKLTATGACGSWPATLDVEISGGGCDIACNCDAADDAAITAAAPTMRFTPTVTDGVATNCNEEVSGQEFCLTWRGCAQGYGLWSGCGPEFNHLGTLVRMKADITVYIAADSDCDPWIDSGLSGKALLRITQNGDFGASQPELLFYLSDDFDPLTGGTFYQQTDDTGATCDWPSSITVSADTDACSDDCDIITPPIGIPPPPTAAPTNCCCNNLANVDGFRGPDTLTATFSSTNPDCGLDGVEVTLVRAPGSGVCDEFWANTYSYIPACDGAGWNLYLEFHSCDTPDGAGGLSCMDAYLIAYLRSDCHTGDPNGVRCTIDFDMNHRSVPVSCTCDPVNFVFSLSFVGGDPVNAPGCYSGLCPCNACDVNDIGSPYTVTITE